LTALMTMKSQLNFHYLQPDYSKEPFQLPDPARRSIYKKLRFLYADQADFCFKEIQRVIQVYAAHKTPEMLAWEKTLNVDERFTEKDVILITYGDLVRNKREKPLHVLAEICSYYLRGTFNTIHILPFFPYSSDRGFAVMNFEEVDPHLGTWEDIIELKKDFRLMFDGVLNHVSSKSRWFQEFLNQNPSYTDFFTVFSTRDKISADHLKLITRPRTTDIVSPFDTLYGRQWVWTTFSADQIDLNYKNPYVLIKMIEILLTYIWRGADIIRMDAVTYLWEELGTSCVHLDQSHTIIKLFRDILNAVAPHIALITETNVEHKDNIRYFGNGYDEAQLVYNFALPPLVLHTFQTGNALKLSKWAKKITKVSNRTSYFNFLDSHDGVGVMAVRNILNKQEIEMMALRVLEHGGYISYKDNGDGTESPYEVNITWYSSLNREDNDEPMEIQIRRYLASRAIALAFMGVPGIYIHGLLGSKNDAELVLEEKQIRSINRKNINKHDLIRALGNKGSTTHHIWYGMVKMIHARIKEKAFHPNSEQVILDLQDSLFGILRRTTDRKDAILALVNITAQRQEAVLDLKLMGIHGPVWRDLLSRLKFSPINGLLTLKFKPYQVLWLKNCL
jgi:glycosidase